METVLSEGTAIVIENWRKPADFFTGLYEGNRHVALGEDHSAVSLHKLVAKLVKPLAKSGIKSICLELPVSTQVSIDRYLATGNEEHIKKLIEEHEKLIREGRQFQGRLEGKESNYFSILRNSRKFKAKVTALGLDYNEGMAYSIPKSPSFIYAGEFHTRKDGIPSEYEQRIDLRKEIAIAQKQGIYSVATMPNPLHAQSSEYKNEVRDFFAKILQELEAFEPNPKKRIPQAFGIDLKESGLAVLLNKLEEQAHPNIESARKKFPKLFAKWKVSDCFDGILFY